MELKSIQKASKILERIKVLDEEIVEIDKFANKLLNGGLDTKIKLSFKKDKKNSPGEVSIDADGSLVTGKKEAPLGMFSGFFISSQSDKKDDDVLEFENCISEQTMLQALGLLVQVKNSEREEKLKQLQKMGFKL